MEETLVQSTVSPLLQYGVLGIVVIVFAVVIYALWKSGNAERERLMGQISTLQEARVVSERAIQEARVADHARVQATLLEVTKQSTAATAAATAAVEAIRETMSEVKQTMREIGDELRHHRS